MCNCWCIIKTNKEKSRMKRNKTSKIILVASILSALNSPKTTLNISDLMTVDVATIVLNAIMTVIDTIISIFACQSILYLTTDTQT